MAQVLDLIGASGKGREHIQREAGVIGEVGRIGIGRVEV
jgi:hypothetical protein